MKIESVFAVTIIVLQFAIFGLVVAQDYCGLPMRRPINDVRTSDDFYIELRSSGFNGSPLPYASIYILGFNRIAAYRDGKFYECHDLPQSLREEVIYWINADYRSIDINQPISFDNANASGLYESAIMIPVGEIMFRRQKELTFAYGNRPPVEGFHQLITKLMHFVINDSNQIQSVPHWLDNFYEAAGEETISEVIRGYNQNK